MKIDSKRESNHFNFIRLFAAFLVFYGHMPTLVGNGAVSTVLNHELGVFIFFAISGYLISMSWDKDPSIKRFFIRRALRIFPALIIVTLVCVFILGPIMTTWELKEYFTSQYIVLYLKNIFLYISYYLPGVFEHNPYPNAVNGSLWSLPVEFFMYIVVAVFGVIGNYKKYLALGLFLFFVTVTILSVNTIPDTLVFYGVDFKQIPRTGVFFWAGATMFHWNIKKYFSFESFVIAILFLMFTYQWDYVYSVISLFLIPFAVLSFGFSHSNILSLFNKFDYSYGFYIYAFPVQQSLVYLYPYMQMSYLLTMGFIITMVLAILSWHYVEKPMIQLKPKR
ncbi:MAG: acyltransferase [Epsilonproteobacteria bacterium]|nr:acyltransferase [Campylobacterota bacterium]